MKRTFVIAKRLLPTMAILLVAGCGTILSVGNLDRPAVERTPSARDNLIYGGVRLSTKCAFDSEYCQHVPFMRPFFAIDIPVSLVGDTLALPYTAVKRTYQKPEPE